ncbi:MAG: AAA family ATPase [Firmicutes bacterium]|nr:AAA family ATPase [Bacillota bacterium]
MSGLEKVRDYLNARFLEREEVIDGLLVALVARQHAVLLGPPGTAKSELIGELAACFTGARCFRWLLTRFSTPEEVFGPVSLAALEEGSYRRVTAGKLPEAEVAFIDEIFKASSAILNTLLAVMNERIFHNDGQPVEVPLISLFAASNELPEEGEGLEALYDRFLLRFQVDYIGEEGHFAALLSASEPPERPEVPLSELYALQAASRSVKVPPEVVEAVVGIRRELASSGITASDRRWRQCVDLVRASAAISERDTAELSDLDPLCHALWSEPEQREAVFSVVKKISDPYGLRLCEIQAEAKEIADAALSAARDGADAAAAGLEALKKLQALKVELKGMNTARAKSVLSLVQARHAAVASACLGIESGAAAVEEVGA